MDYCLNENRKCTKINLKGCSSSKIINKKEIFFVCNKGYYLEKEQCKKILPTLEENKIEGFILYDIIYNIYYCVKCDNKYLEKNGYCHLIPNYPILRNCKSYGFYSGKIYCTECYGDYYNDRYSYDNMIICGNKYFGNCTSITNKGERQNPKYSC